MQAFFEIENRIESQWTSIIFGPTYFYYNDEEYNFNYANYASQKKLLQKKLWTGDFETFSLFDIDVILLNYYLTQFLLIVIQL